MIARVVVAGMLHYIFVFGNMCASTGFDLILHWFRFSENLFIMSFIAFFLAIDINRNICGMMIQLEKSGRMINLKKFLHDLHGKNGSRGMTDRTAMLAPSPPELAPC